MHTCTCMFSCSSLVSPIFSNKRLLVQRDITARVMHIMLSLIPSHPLAAFFASVAKKAGLGESACSAIAKLDCKIEVLQSVFIFLSQL